MSFFLFLFVGNTFFFVDLLFLIIFDIFCYISGVTEGEADPVPHILPAFLLRIMVGTSCNVRKETMTGQTDSVFIYETDTA
jgi:hypothetical protein